jgi:pyruvate formate lyase activating enzyme
MDHALPGGIETDQRRPDVCETIMNQLTRRRFLVSGAAAVCTAALPGPALAGVRGLLQKAGPDDVTGVIFKGDAPRHPWKWSKEAFDYHRLPDQSVVCGICPHGCVLEKQDRGICRSKVNINGKLYSLAYGNPCSVNIDPVEKKPLFHFHPRSTNLSIAAAGCNFRCLNCQNWEISQVYPESLRTYELFPAQVVEKAIEVKAEAVAYTYSEAISYFEYMIDTARVAHEKGLYNLWISNGYINPAPLDVLCDVLDAANINLKCFSDDVYRKLNGGRLGPVLETFKALHKRNVHFEITTLMVPGYVDDPEIFSAMCRWIIENLGPDYPLHLLRFFPRYKLDRLPPTPVATLTEFRQFAMKKGIRYVYVGNVPGHEGNHTYCHHCGKLLIERQGYLIKTYDLEKNICKHCKTVIPGRWT